MLLSVDVSAVAVAAVMRCWIFFACVIVAVVSVAVTAADGAIFVPAAAAAAVLEQMCMVMVFYSTLSRCLYNGTPSPPRFRRSVPDRNRFEFRWSTVRVSHKKIFKK